jgi:hypothetical protein
MANCKDKVEAKVLFIKPAGTQEGWEKSDLWHSAAVIPGVTVISDINSTEARLFRAKTSGQTILYDSEGRLQFSGGITGSRGHSGDNVGRSAIVSILTQGVAQRTSSFVFGCSLFDSDSK